MTFLRYSDDIINLERITHIHKEEVVCEAIPSGVVHLYKVVLAGDGQELKIRCDSEEEADKTLSTIEELLKKLYGLYKFTETNHESNTKHN